MSLKQVVLDILGDHPEPNEQVYYYRRRYYSAEFYSHGKTHILANWQEVRDLLDRGELHQLVITDDDAKELPKSLEQRLTQKQQYGYMQVLDITSSDTVSLNEDK